MWVVKRIISGFTGHSAGIHVFKQVKSFRTDYVPFKNKLIHVFVLKVGSQKTY